MIRFPRPQRARRIVGCRSAVLIALAALAASHAMASEDAMEPAVDARQVKAAFVMNFLKFVEWPAAYLEAPPAPIEIAVLGDVGFGWTLQKVATGESVNGHPVLVRVIGRIEHGRDVHLLFIGASEQSRLSAILRETASTPVLTVGDTDGFGRAGVVLNFYTFDQRVRIEVNTAAAERAGLKLSAHLLRIARIVG